MKRTGLIIVTLLLLTIPPMGAQNVEHRDVLQVSFGGIWQQDQYLSPLMYQGLQAGISNEWWQDFNHEHWSHVGSVAANFGWSHSQMQTNRLYQAQIQFGWGGYYHWDWKPQGWQVLVGPYLNIDIAPRYHVANVNKPFSIDLAADIMAMAGVSYGWKYRNTSYRVQYLVKANVIGVDWVPDYWESYYEISEGVMGQVRCSGVWNHRTLNQQIHLDMQFAHSTWRIGVRHEYKEYGIQNMMFSTEQVSAVIGCIFHYRLHPNKSLVNE